MAQRFIEFVMMQAQNAALFLGQIPNPQTGAGEVNLELAKMFIDQLAMIQEKTRGNLSSEENTVLRNAISNLQMAFVEVSENERGAGAPAAAAPVQNDAPSVVPESGKIDTGVASSVQSETEGKKKFTKSYGA